MSYTEIQGTYASVKAGIDAIIAGGATTIYAVIEPQKGKWIIIHD